MTSSIVLVKQAQVGDPEAWKALVARYSPRLQKWVHGRLPSAARHLLDTDDVIQEVLMALLRRLPALEDAAAFPGYLRQAVLNRLRDAYRRQVYETGWKETFDYADFRPGPAEDLRGGDLARRYEAILTGLSERDRGAIVGRLEWGLAYSELAAELGLASADAARMAVSRALVRLTRALRDEPAG